MPLPYILVNGQWVLATAQAQQQNPDTPVVYTNEQAEQQYGHLYGKEPYPGTVSPWWETVPSGGAVPLPEVPPEGTPPPPWGIAPPYETMPPEVTPPEAYANPWAPASPQFMEEEYGRWPGFGTALGLFGRQYLSPHEQYLAGQQAALERLYDIGGRLGTAGGLGQYTPGGMFSQWAPQYAQNPAGMYGLAGGMMGSVMGMTPEQRATADIGYETNPQALQDLLALSLRTQLGKQTAGWLSGQLPAARQSWMAQYPQQQGPSFLDYISQKYNLGQYF